MKARPILFSGDMVRALLDGRKTQTRRALKIQPSNGWEFGTASNEEIILGAITSSHPKKGRFGAFIRREIWEGAGKFQHDVIACPCGRPGDLLWVRETFISGFEFDDNGMPTEQERTWYRANGDLDFWYDGGSDFPKENIPWRPSIHMPRWASRLTLRITNVRVERLQDMEGQHPNESDAIAEGVNAIHHGDGDYYYSAFRQEPHPENWCDPTDAFRELWESINGPESWTANPWVWVIEFEVIHANVDTVLKEQAA